MERTFSSSGPLMVKPISENQLSSISDEPRLLENHPSASSAIRREIQRFELVHPSIYAIYDLIEFIANPLLALQIKKNLICIEDTFVNSQEWTLSRDVPVIRIGVIGSTTSGKTALVHRYLTGAFIQEDSPDGGRFKKEIIVDGRTYLLLIRDEGGSPNFEFTAWVDAVLFVFNLANEPSFNIISNYHAKMSQFRNMSDISVVFVGSKDQITPSRQLQPIDTRRIRKLANDLRKSPYFETCSAYGLNVEKVFQEACQGVCRNKANKPIPSARIDQYDDCLFNRKKNHPFAKSYTERTYNFVEFEEFPVMPERLTGQSSTLTSVGSTFSSIRPANSLQFLGTNVASFPCEGKISMALRVDNKREQIPASSQLDTIKDRQLGSKFQTNTLGGCAGFLDQPEIGSGRSIPILQGVLLMKTNKSFGKDWKKKYVTLRDDGRIAYYPSLNDYMSNVNGKEILLQYVTVKVPGRNPRGLKRISQTKVQFNNFDNTEQNGKVKNPGSDKPLGKEGRNCPEKDSKLKQKKKNSHLSQKVMKKCTKNSSLGLEVKYGYDDQFAVDEFEFQIVCLDSKKWFFKLNSSEERDAWVASTEQQILHILQFSESHTGKQSSSDELKIKSSLKSEVRGNTKCAECDCPNPNWASINLGVLICIECSGIHRKLGSHISKVRSLDLDEWSPGHLAVLTSLGNKIANSIWEGNLSSKCALKKPTPNSSQEEKEVFIIAKYCSKEFLQPLPSGLHRTLLLAEGIERSDPGLVALALAHSAKGKTDFFKHESSTLLLQSSVGNMAIVQMLDGSNSEVKAFKREGGL